MRNNFYRYEIKNIYDKVLAWGVFSSSVKHEEAMKFDDIRTKAKNLAYAHFEKEDVTCIIYYADETSGNFDSLGKVYAYRTQENG